MYVRGYHSLRRNSTIKSTYMVVERQNGRTTELQNYRTTELVRGYHSLRRNSTIKSTYMVVERQNGRTTELQNYRTTELQNYRTTELQNYRTTELQNYRTTELQNYRTLFHNYSYVHLCIGHSSSDLPLSHHDGNDTSNFSLPRKLPKSQLTSRGPGADRVPSPPTKGKPVPLFLSSAPPPRIAAHVAFARHPPELQLTSRGPCAACVLPPLTIGKLVPLIPRVCATSLNCSSRGVALALLASSSL